MLRVKSTKRSKKPSHNSALGAKVNIRRWLVEQLGGLSKVRVLDCFCAGGLLWQHAYERNPKYLGVDLRQFDDERRTIVSDSRRLLRHVDFDVSVYNLFDLDAFGSPLEHLALICHRLRQRELPAGDRLGFVLTDGTGFNARMNGTNRGLLNQVGLAPHKGSQVQSVFRDDIFSRSVVKSLVSAGLEVLESRASSMPAGRGHGMTETRYVAVLAGR